MITPLDLWAGIAAGVACVAMGLRANMLKPKFQRWRTPPTIVWVALLVCSAILGGASVSLLTGDAGIKGTAREAVVYTILAISALVLLWNLGRQRHDPDVVDREPPAARPAAEKPAVTPARWTDGASSP